MSEHEREPGKEQVEDEDRELSPLPPEGQPGTSREEDDSRGSDG
jgi:hypothetical protein